MKQGRQAALWIVVGFVLGSHSFDLTRSALAQSVPSLQSAIHDAGATIELSRRLWIRNWPHSTWWTQSHAIDTMLNFDQGGVRILGPTYFWLSWRPWFNYQNNIYDDEGWWAIAWLHAYVASGKTNLKYYNRAVTLYNHILNHGWVNTCGGSLAWKQGYAYQNAVTNGIFARLSLDFYDATSDQKYLDEANKILHWIDQSKLLDNPEHLVNDGLTVGDTTQCSVNPSGAFWTYNQGLFIDVFTRLNEVDRAWDLFAASEKYFIRKSNGSLFERNCDDSGGAAPCGVDGIAFRGIFLKNLHSLATVLSSKHDSRFAVLKSFADAQALHVMNSPQDKHGWYPQRWDDAGNPAQYTPITHVTATEALLLSDFVDRLQ